MFCVAFGFSPPMIRPGIKSLLFAPALALAALAQDAAQKKEPAAAPAALENGALPVVTPRIDDGAALRGLAPGEIGGLSVELPPGREAQSPARQNRVQPANADTLRNADRILDPRQFVYSPNWLVDGVARLEAEEKRRARLELAGGDRRRADGSADAVSGNAPGVSDLDARDAGDPAATATARDPLAEYLQKWTGGAPAAAAVSTAPAEGRYDRGYEAAAVDGGGAPGDFAPGRAPEGGINYPIDLTRTELESTGPSIFVPPPPVAPQQSAAASSGVPTPGDGATRDFAGIPENKRLVIKPVKNLESQAKKPVVNDKKYFPQLNRF